jgi:hypothetical protein
VPYSWHNLTVEFKQVWIAAVDAKLNTAEAQPGWHTVSTSLPPMDRDFYAVTFEVGYLVFQVSGRDFRQTENDPRTGQPLRIFVSRPDCLLPYINSIWSAVGPQRTDTVTWPRDARLRLAQWNDTAVFREKVVALPNIGKPKRPRNL